MEFYREPSLVEIGKGNVLKGASEQSEKVMSARRHKKGGTAENLSSLSIG